MSISQTTVYEAEDPGGAQRLAQALADDTAKRPTSQTADAVPGLPQSRCIRTEDSARIVTRYWCITTADRYTFKAVAQQLDNAQHQLAAQYRILAS